MSTGTIRPRALPRRAFLAGSAALALAGCAVNYSAPVASVPDSFGSGTPARRDNGRDWTRAFEDRQLDGLIAAGRARNLDIAQARIAITEAEAGAGITRAGALPQASVTGSAQRGDSQGSGAIRETSGLGLGVSWVLDLFGANANARAAAEARLDASWLSADVTSLLIEGAIASAYADLRFQQASSALIRRSIDSRRKSLALTRAQEEAGVASRLDLIQAEQLVAEGEAQLPAREVAFDQALARLAALTAQASTSLRPGLEKGASQPRPRFSASVGLPADVVRERPDVRLNERLFAAAAYEVGVAQAQFWPSVSLSGNITATRISGGGNITPWGFGPAINLPIFTGGANAANLKGAEARAAKARLAWEAAVLKAVEEVESGLAATSRDVRNVAAQQKLVDTSAQAVELARTSFALGDGTFFNVLEAERSLLNAQQGLAQAQYQRALHYIALSLAAAGGTAPGA